MADRTALPIPLTAMVRLRQQLLAMARMAAASDRDSLAAACATAADEMQHWINDTLPPSAPHG